MTYDFEVSGQISTTPQEIYEAWLSSEGHSAMTGGLAHVDPVLGGAFDAWDGYIHGKNLVLEPYTRIVQSWRSAQFTDEHEDSTIEVLLTANNDGTLMTIRHTNVPDDQLGYEKGGWERSYVTPMQGHFASK
ncbi:MAG TPA: SRPBCC domain-containing protein [Acidimicrobiales bacterium]